MIIIIIIIAINGIDVGTLWVYIVEENFSNRWNASRLRIPLPLPLVI